MQQIIRQYGNFLLAALAALGIVSMVVVHFLGTDGGVLHKVGTDYESTVEENGEQRLTGNASSQEVIAAVESEQPQVTVKEGLKSGITYSAEDLVNIDGDYVSVTILGVYDVNGNLLSTDNESVLLDRSNNTLIFHKSGIYFVKCKVHTAMQSYMRELTFGISR